MNFLLNDLVYTPGNRSLENMSISLSALHYTGELEYDFHNLNGILHLESTYLGMKHNMMIDMPLIITRNTYVGSGKFGGHWAGDNESTWRFLRLSIGSLFNFNVNKFLKN